MLQYAFTKETQSLTHVDEVPNGKLCQCYCPACDDDLEAHNAGRIQAHHFKHTTKAERRACLMTQLHLWGQHYFHNAEQFMISAPVISYRNRIIDQDKFLTIKPTASLLEKRMGPYFADVHLQTDIEELVVEIKVTHACEPEKLDYYSHNKVAAVEIDLSRFSDTPISEVEEHFKEHDMVVEWIYPYGKEQAIEQHLIKLKIERQDAIKEATFNAQKVLRDLPAKHSLKLPALMVNHKPISKNQFGDNDVSIVLQEPVKATFDQVDLTRTDEYFLYRCTIGQRAIHILAYFESEPDVLEQLKNSILVLKPNSSTLSWHRHARYAELRQDRVIEWEAIHAVKSEISSVIGEAISSFRGNDYFFKQGYGRWRNLIKQNELFQPTVEKKNPPIPDCLRHISKDYELWMFDAWPVHVATELIATVDSRPETEFTFDDIFNLLCLQFPLDPRYTHVIKLMNDNGLDPSTQGLDSRSIILKLLRAQFDEGWLSIQENTWVRNRPKVTMLKQLYRFETPRY